MFIITNQLTAECDYVTWLFTWRPQMIKKKEREVTQHQQQHVGVKQSQNILNWPSSIDCKCLPKWWNYTVNLYSVRACLRRGSNLQNSQRIMGLTLFSWFPMIVSQIWLVLSSYYYYYYYLSHYRGIPNVVFPRKLSCCWIILEICLTLDRMVQRPLMGQTISSVFPSSSTSSILFVFLRS